ncbi:S-norcoclaurine synthase 1-like [Hibiscus syriacus]|uniref:S-norcoclaurine synthase 1-like n=1 Tax=Hibiscus syriacus TaxID=106335 RepID=A0A6A2XTE9_HIBSY|nr:S-norcoclaurine synthase 1-like [Hibiscus syriacus]
MLSKLEANEGRIAITTDMWTSDHQNKGYMVVTAHYIDNSWSLQKRIIRFEYVPAPHTTDVIASSLMKCFLDWNIDRKHTSITVDNCSVNDGVIKLLVDRMGDSIGRIRHSVLFWSATPKSYIVTLCTRTCQQMLIGLLHRIRVALNEWITHSDIIISRMAKCMLEKFEKYWNDMNGITGVATILDPRYKTTLLEYYFENIYGVTAEHKVERIVQLCRDLVIEYEERIMFSKNEPQPFNDASLDSVLVDLGNPGDFDAYISRKRQKKTKVRSELDRYLEVDVISRTSDFDILTW